jgi:hypothetical protein
MWNKEEIYFLACPSPWVSGLSLKFHGRYFFQLYTFFALELLDLERVKRLEPK